MELAELILGPPQKVFLPHPHTLINKIGYLINNFIASHRYQVNDDHLRKQFLKEFMHAMTLWHPQQEVAAICDATNNPPDTIDKGHLMVDILLGSGTHRFTIYRFKNGELESYVTSV